MSKALEKFFEQNMPSDDKIILRWVKDFPLTTILRIMNGCLDILHERGYAVKDWAANDRELQKISFIGGKTYAMIITPDNSSSEA